MIFSRAVIVILAVLLVACTTTDPYTGEQKTSNAAKGAGIGAITGAVLGAATSSDKKKGALKGAVAGGAIGGGIGYYMDRQEARMREILQGTGVSVRREGDNLYLIMPGNITFASGRSEINAGFYEVLNSVGLVLKEFDKTDIEISGHTDSTGDKDKNQLLSEDRASSVGRYLVGRGVAQVRIRSVGYAARYPVASNSTAAGREQNRRVELKLIPR